MILGRDIKLPDDSPEEKEVSDNWKKRQRYVHKCKETAWKRWVHECLAALRERHNLSHKEKPVKININDVVMIKGGKKNRGKWKIGIIENIFVVKDNTIRSIRIHTGKNVIERPVQLLYPMALHCDSKSTTSNTQDEKTLNVNAKEFRPKRSGAAAAEQRIRDTADNENQERHLICIIKCGENNVEISRSSAI